jgi:hypothetical protein
MNEDRFRELSEAFGGDLCRWPEAERADAEAFAAACPEAARAALAEAEALDRLLFAFAAGAASQNLRARIVDAAPRQRAVGRAWRWVAGAGLGVGLAACCAAGVAAGFTLAPRSVTRMIAGPAQAENNDLSALADPAGDAASG